ncbi:MAG: hypothetical protein HYS45_00370 [Parcubacteria group bacterium]|nr:hypothetical protein [Parcubacteria group bacterium]
MTQTAVRETEWVPSRFHVGTGEDGGLAVKWSPIGAHQELLPFFLVGGARGKLAIMAHTQDDPPSLVVFFGCSHVFVDKAKRQRALLPFQVFVTATRARLGFPDGRWRTEVKDTSGYWTCEYTIPLPLLRNEDPDISQLSETMKTLAENLFGFRAGLLAIQSV